MKRTLLMVFVVVIVSQLTYSQNKIWNETEEQKTERLAWWTDARFGMFIHWGLYAQAARHEWVKKINVFPMKNIKSISKYLTSIYSWPRSGQKVIVPGKSLV